MSQPHQRSSSSRCPSNAVAGNAPWKAHPQRRVPLNPRTVLTLRTRFQDRVYLKVSFYEKEDAKTHGACWDHEHKLWFVAPECFEAIALWPRVDNPYPPVVVMPPLEPVLGPHLPSAPHYRRSRATSKPITVDRFGNVLTDADLSA